MVRYKAESSLLILVRRALNACNPIIQPGFMR